MNQSTGGNNMGLLSKLLGAVSGNNGLVVSEQLLFDKVIGFKGVTNGVGTSTVVQNVAYAISQNTNYSVCVLDTNFLAPSLYPMMVDASEPKNPKDYLEFTGDLQELVVNTKYRNVYLLHLQNRGILDMMSNKDNELTIEKVIGALKSYYDIVLIDLSQELTNTSTISAIKCNKIYLVCDLALKTTYNLRKTLNTMSILAIPTTKVTKVILNKTIPDVSTNLHTLFKESGLTEMCNIPMSQDIATLGISGQHIWTQQGTSKDIISFSNSINAVMKDIIQVTPLNAKYVSKPEVEKAKAVYDEEQKKKKEKE